MFVSVLPYHGVLGLSGLTVILSGHLHISDQTLSSIVVGSVLLNGILAGFTSLPHQEFVTACIPSTHRARFTGYSMSVGAALAFVANSLGGWILYATPKPMAFGYLFLCTFLVCQGGYVLSLFARETPTPVEASPKPWSRQMFLALWRDKPFLRFLMVWAIPQVTYYPFITFIPIFALKDLRMEAYKLAILATVTLVLRMASSPLAGNLVDRIGPKRVLYIAPLYHAGVMLMLLAWPSVWTVFVVSSIREVAGIVVNAGMVVLLYGLPRPEHRAGHFTMQIIANCLTGGIGVLIGGFLLDIFSFRTAFLASAIVALVWFPILCWMIRPFSNNARDYS